MKQAVIEHPSRFDSRSNSVDSLLTSSSIDPVTFQSIDKLLSQLCIPNITARRDVGNIKLQIAHSCAVPAASTSTITHHPSPSESVPVYSRVIKIKSNHVIVNDTDLIALVSVFVA